MDGLVTTQSNEQINPICHLSTVHTLNYIGNLKRVDW